MNEFNVLEMLEQTSGSNDKITILNNNANNKELVDLLDASLNAQRRYFVKKFDNTSHGVGIAPTHEQFMGLLRELETRCITGNAALTRVRDFFTSCNDMQVKWYTRVLKKDLKCNFGISSCKKAGINIHEFEVQLATDSNKCKKIESIVRSGVMVSPKLDGYRCLAVGIDGDFVLYTRNGNIYENFPIIEEALSTTFPKGSYVFDGEIMSDNFNAMQKSAFASKRGTTVGDVKYFIFDTIPYDEFIKNTFTTKYFDRYENLCKILLVDDELKNDLLQVVKHTYYNKIDEIRDVQHSFESIGYEGCMVNPNIPYYFGRKSNALLKFKSMLSQDCTVTDMYLGEKDSKYANTLGGFIVLQENNKKCGVGSGFSDDDRDTYWNNQHEYIGKTVEVKYQELGSDGRMRFPVMVKWRNDK